MKNILQGLTGLGGRGGGRRLGLPKLVIAQRVIDKIVANATIYATETGESLVGLAIPNPESANPEPDLYVLDTIPPDDSAIREGAYFEQGDDLQGDMFNWLYDNWKHIRKRRTLTDARFDLPLSHLGDWHKHPGTLVTPSWGDTDTARGVVFDRTANTPHVLVVLATVWDSAIPPTPEELAEQKAAADEQDIQAAEFDDLVAVAGLKDELTALSSTQATGDKPNPEDVEPIRVKLSDTAYVRIDSWYMSRNIRHFVRLAPEIVPNDTLPALPPIGWHLRHPDRMKAEINALTRDGYAVSVEQYDADHNPPLEVCLSCARRDGSHILIAVTQADYPTARPALRRTPMSAMRDIPEGARLFDRLWAQSQPVAEADYPPDWSPDTLIADLARALDAKPGQK